MNVVNEQTSATEKQTEFVVYKRRWIVLVLFVLYSSANSFHWVNYSIIATIVMKYYGIDSTTVDWTSMVFMISYVLLFLPGGYLMDKKGLRTGVLVGAVMNFAGAWIKVIGTNPNRFWAAFIGQTCAAVAQVFVLSVPVKLAAVWFGPDQVSTACSVTVFGNQIGVALSIFIVPLVVQMHDNIEDIGSDMRILAYVLAGVATVVLVLIVIFFPSRPPTPPSLAQQILESEGDKTNFKDTAKAIVKNVPLILFMISYGIGGGVINAITTLLNQIIIMNHPNTEEQVGNIGIVVFISGLVGVVFFGMVMDKTRKYKETMLLVYFGCLISGIAFTFLLHVELKYLFISATLQGCFLVTFISIGFEFAAEISYPLPEATVGGIITCALQIFAIILTSVYAKLLHTYNDYVANGTLCAFITVGLIINIFVKNDLKRQQALTNNPENNKPVSTL